VNILNAALELP